MWLPRLVPTRCPNDVVVRIDGEVPANLSALRQEYPRQIEEMNDKAAFPAEECYREALKIYREGGAQEGLDYANAVTRMADLLEKTGEDDDALVHWAESKERYAALGLAAGVEEAERHIKRLSAC